MVAEERVVIHVEIDSDLAKDRAQMEAWFQSLHGKSTAASKDLDVLEKRMDRVDRKSHSLSKSNNKVENSYVRLTKAVKNVGRAFGNFLSKFSLFSFIGSAIEIGLISIALLGVKAALVSGRLAMKAYQATLTGLGVAAGGVAVALGGVAAAMRQISEVTLGPNIGGNRKAAQALRSAMGDQQLSFYGMEGVSSSVSALAKGGVSTDASYTTILKQLGDYTADPKELADLATIYASISKSGTITDDSLGKLGDINPAMVAGIKELSGLSPDALEKALGEDGDGVGSSVFNAMLSGQAEATNAWEGQLARMNNTVVGTLKGMLPRMFQLFAGMGEPFLNTIQETLMGMEEVIRGVIFRIRATVTGFGLDKMIPGLMSLFEKLGDFVARLINESLPKVNNWGEKLMGWWDTIRNYFMDMVRIFEPLEEAADVLISVLGKQVGPMFDGFAMLIKNFADTLVRNRGAFEKFGESVGNVFSSIFGFFDNANNAFVDALPTWTNLMNVIAFDVVPALRDVFDMMHEASQTVLPGITAALSAIASVLSHVAGILSMIMNIPGIGQVLGLAVGGMLLKTTRKPMMAAAGSVVGRAGAAAGVGGAYGTAGAATTGGILAAGLKARIPLGGYGMGGVMKGLPSAMGTGTMPMTAAGAPAAAATTSAGALLGMTAASGLGGYVGGTVVGDRVGGAGGIAAGAGAGAAIGAGIGAALTSWTGFGVPAGMAVGGAIGAVGGAGGAWFAHRRDEKAGVASTELVDDFYDNVQGMLNKGQGREAFREAEKQMTDMLKNVAKTAKELGVDEEELRKDLLDAQDKLTDVVAAKTKILDDRVGYLSSTSGMAADEIERLANVMGVDLADGAGRALEQLKAIDAVTDYDMSLPGIEDAVNKSLQASLYGPGSYFEREFLAPESQDAYNASINEIYDIVRGGGTPDSGLVAKTMDDYFAFRQTKYGENGLALAEGFQSDAATMDSKMGTGDMWQSIAADTMQVYDDFFDPSKNRAMLGLEAALYDQVKTSVDSIGASEEEIQTMTTVEFQKKMDTLKGLPMHEMDNALARMLRSATDEAQYENMVKFGDSVIRATERLDELLGGGEDDPHNQDGVGSRDSRFNEKPGERAAYAAGGGQSSTSTSSTTVTQRNASSYAQSIVLNANGLGIDEAMIQIERKIAAAVRNAMQRSPRYSTSDGRNTYT